MYDEHCSWKQKTSKLYSNAESIDLIGVDVEGINASLSVKRQEERGSRTDEKR